MKFGKGTVSGRRIRDISILLVRLHICHAQALGLLRATNAVAMVLRFNAWGGAGLLTQLRGLIVITVK